MLYNIYYAPNAEHDILRLYKNEPKAYKKLKALIQELELHPRIGIGHPKPLSADKSGRWSRHITSKHRLEYEIDDIIMQVTVLAARGHYDDK